MPQPKPRISENQNDFINRCMSDPIMVDEYQDSRQRSAVCFSLWERSKEDLEQTQDNEDPEKPKKSFKGEEKETKNVRLTKTFEFDEKEAPKINAAGELEGYLAAFDNVDRDGDVIRKGAFKKTIKDKIDPHTGRIPNGILPLMYVHGGNGGGSWEVCGSIVEAREDDYGLWIKGEFNDDENAQIIRSRVKNQHLRFLSIGYSILRAAEIVEDEKEIFELLELKLWEGTITPFPANELAEILVGKSEFTPDDISQIQKTIENINGKITAGLAETPESPESSGRIHFDAEAAVSLRESLSGLQTALGKVHDKRTDSPDGELKAKATREAEFERLRKEAARCRRTITLRQKKENAKWADKKFSQS